MSNLQSFNFNENQIRILTLEKEPWFVAKDVAGVLEYTENARMLQHVDDEDKQVINPQKLDSTILVESFGSNTFKVSVINESGLYACIFGSHKPEAKVFKKWVTSEVLPQIRKTGSYSLENLSPARQIIKMGESMLELEKEQARQAQELEQTKETSSQALSTAQEAKEGLENVRNELASLKELAIT